MPRAERLGFTLVELMAALALAALVFVGVRDLLDQLADAGTSIDNETATVNASANGERLLTALVYGVDLTEGSTAADSTARFRFTGDATRADFKSWCRVPRGWLEPCHVRLALVTLGDRTVVNARMSTGGSLALLTVAGSAYFLYRDGAARDNSWAPTWGASIVAPAAIGIVAGGGRDTVVLPAGGR